MAVAAFGAQRGGRTVGLVPTMGALHEGHLSLVRAARAENDETVVSIYVNPAQFAPTEDLAQYPRPLDDDLALLAAEGVETVFLPDDREMYPPGHSTFVEPPVVSRLWEGECRPQHFRGVATIVLKLLNLVRPDVVYFGQKDFQQMLVVEAMVRDLNIPTRVRRCPIVRDQDGLALSSRNRYLADDERQRALALSRALSLAERAIRDGQSSGAAVMAVLRDTLIAGGVTKIDYAVVADPRTLELVAHIAGPVVLLIAAWVGSTRLIDNRLVD